MGRLGVSIAPSEHAWWWEPAGPVFAIIGPDARFRMANRRWAEALGTTEELLAGTPLDSVLNASAKVDVLERLFGELAMTTTSCAA